MREDIMYSDVREEMDALRADGWLTVSEWCEIIGQGRRNVQKALAGYIAAGRAEVKRTRRLVNNSVVVVPHYRLITT